jgi:hypothetical protein
VKLKVGDLRAAKVKAAGGAWVKGIVLDELGISLDVKARSLRNTEAAKLRGELVRELPDEHKEKMPPEVSARILAEVLVRTVVVDWSLDEPCTVDLLTDPEIGEYLAGACVAAGGIVADRGVASLEADASNLTAMLRWMVAWGDQLQWLEDLGREEGVTPKALAERPALADHLELEWKAFWTLLSDRTPGPHGGIPFTAIDRYAERLGITGPDAFERFHTLISKMSAALTEAVAGTNLSPSNPA